MLLNENIKDLPESGVSVKKRIGAFLDRTPSATLIRLDQDLMSMPLPPAVTEEMKKAVDEVAEPYGVRLTSPWSGYRNLKKAVVYRLSTMGVEMSEDEVFITAGLESTHSCISHLFAAQNNVILPDPCEERLVRLQQCAGRSVAFARATPENGFVPLPEGDAEDLIYLASPGNVTGVAMDRKSLKKWVDWANENGSIIIYDSSLSEYISEEGYPRSIYEIPGAKECAIEIFSFEKGYGVRELKIGYVIIPSALERCGTRLQQLWRARQPSTATPPSFVMQRAAEMLFSPEVDDQTDRIIYRIKKVAAALSEGLTRAGIPHTGGVCAPFLWAQCPGDMNSWQCFDLLLEKAGCVVTPGSLFGYGGEGFFRLTAFGAPEEALEATGLISEAFSAAKEKKEEETDLAAKLLEE